MRKHVLVALQKNSYIFHLRNMMHKSFIYKNTNCNTTLIEWNKLTVDISCNAW